MLLPPTLTIPTSDPSPTRPNQPGTYGDLMARATEGMHTAQHISVHPFADVASAQEELLGYERFLHVAGVHLQLLAGLAHTPTAPVRKLAGHLRNLRGDEARSGRWYDAATLLGTAHDVVATHLQDGLLPRTHEAEEVLTPPAARHASRHVTELVLGAVSTRAQLCRHALRSQHRLPEAERPISRRHTGHLRTTTTTIEVYAMAALWGLDNDSNARGPETIVDLSPAAPTPAARSVAFASSLEALAVLRQLVHKQAKGDAPASPASLRDLALLGARFTASSVPLPAPQTGLERVRHAHALDAFDAAHGAWTAASRDLTTTIQGLTKAPGAYGAAIHRLLQADPNDDSLRAPVLAALPRLAREASLTIAELGHTGALLAPQRDVSLRRTWTPLPADAVAGLEDRFRTAGQATIRATRSAQEAVRHTTGDAQIDSPPVPSRVRQQRIEARR